MKIPNVTIQQLLEAGVHLGHKTLRWNPKMKKYIFGKRDSIHIIDLTQTLELTKIALEKVYETISNNGKILFVSTKKQASEAIARLLRYKFADTGKDEESLDDLGGDDIDLGGSDTPSPEPAAEPAAEPAEDDLGIPASVDDL